MRGSHAAHPKCLDVLHATFQAPDLTRFCWLDELGLEVIGQRVSAQGAVLECRVVELDEFRRGCGAAGQERDTVARPPARSPFGQRPTTLGGPSLPLRQVWAAVAPGHDQGGRAALEAVARIADGVEVRWHTVASAVLDEEQPADR